ncbi:MAG: multiheme c-type cytochrome [Pirellulales bacterium]
MSYAVLPTGSWTRLAVLCTLLAAWGWSVRTEAAAPATSIPDRGPETSDAVAESLRQKNGSIFVGWNKPQAVLLITGELNGYIEPCGCAGKENQKGGLSRRQNLLRAVKAAGWPQVSVDLGNQVRRFGRQAEVKFQSVADGLREMGYGAVGFGPDDLRLPAEELIAAVAAVGDQGTPFVSANVGLLGLDAGITPRFQVVEAGGMTIGITSVLGDKESESIRNDSLEMIPAAQALRDVTGSLTAAKCDAYVLLSYASPEESKRLAEAFPQFDVVVTAGGADEPPMIPPQLSNNAGVLIELGHKGMYAVAVAFYDDEQAARSSVQSVMKTASGTPFLTQRIPLDARWGESDEMIRLLASYQQQLETLGLNGLKLGATRHPTGRRFAGSQACAACHESAFEVWEASTHASALVTLEEATPPRDHDPECLSCHVVGWVPQKYEPYEGGFLSRLETPHLAQQGCENCHGPAAAHAAVEEGDVVASEVERERLRTELSLSIATPEGRKKAVNNCLECHDLDNSPSFDFDEYWPTVAH